MNPRRELEKLAAASGVSVDEIKRALRETLDEGLTREDRKSIYKEAINEWLDDIFKRVGRWTVYSALALAFAGTVYLVLLLNGWHK